MAFVARSPKQCQFLNNRPHEEHESQNKLASITEFDQRIHHQCDQNFKRLLKSKSLNKQIQRCQTYSQIKSNELEKEKKLTYNFNLLKKHKLIFRPNQNNCKQQLQQPKQYYDLPGCISPKTMVKYADKKQLKRKKQIQQQCSPGPAAYSPNTSYSIKSPKFHRPKFANLSVLNSANEEENIQDAEEKLFAVRYNFMNSSNFKKSPNLIKYSNKILLSKLFDGKQHKPKQTLLDQYEQYTQIVQQSPGPGSYSLKYQNKVNSSKFGNEKRFMMNISQGSNNFYQLIPSPSLPIQNQNAVFACKVGRFSKQNMSYLPLQYSNYQNSMLQQTKNRQIIGFASNSQKFPSITKTDNKPFYNITAPTTEFHKFSEIQINRCQFQKSNEETPGPGSYDLNENWKLQYGCLIFKSNDSEKVANKLNKQNNSSNFCLSSISKLGETKQKVTNKKFIEIKKMNNKTIKMKEQEKIKYYDVSVDWQKKSFNKYFTNEILHANNPIQSKIL